MLSGIKLGRGKVFDRIKALRARSRHNNAGRLWQRAEEKIRFSNNDFLACMVLTSVHVSLFKRSMTLACSDSVPCMHILAFLNAIWLDRRSLRGLENY